MMKNIILVFSLFILCATASMAEIVYLEEYVKGQDTGRKIIADIYLPKNAKSGQDRLVWHQVFISPFHGRKMVALTPQIYSLDNGSITNLNRSRDKITFRLNLSYYSPKVNTGARYMDIVITTNLDGSIDNISGASQWTDLDTNRIFNVQWKKTLKRNFILPYNVVF